MTAAQETPRSFLEVSKNFNEHKRSDMFMKVRCVEHVERVCATAALEDRWEVFQNVPEVSRKFSGNFPETKPSHIAPGPRSALALVI